MDSGGLKMSISKNTIMSKLLVFLFITLTCISFKTFAESAVGNGGVGIFCGYISDYEYEDIYIVDYIEGLSKGLSYNKLDKLKSADLFLQKLSQYSPRRAKKIKKEFDSFLEQVNFVANQEIINPNDTYAYINLENCEHKTIILQSSIESNLIKKYLVQENYFKQLDPTNLIILKVHEIIYREALMYNHKNSEYTRKLTQNLLSDQVDNFLQTQYFSLLNRYNIPRDSVND